jgi:hypothetical protein
MDGKEVKRERPELHDPHVPRFPVIYKKPTSQQVRDNVSQADLIQSAVVGAASFPLGYIVGAYQSINVGALRRCGSPRPAVTAAIILSVARQLGRTLARPGMWFTGIIGTLGGAMLAYQNSSLRLQGFGRNDEEVARYQPTAKKQL